MATFVAGGSAFASPPEVERHAADSVRRAGLDRQIDSPDLVQRDLGAIGQRIERRNREVAIGVDQRKLGDRGVGLG